MDTIVNKFIPIALISIISISCIAQTEQHAESYSVQIAAYKNLPDNFIKSVKKYGSVHTSQLGELTRVSVGNFENKSAALELLLQLKKSGYEGAFIRHMSSSIASNQSQNSPRSEMAKFRTLSEPEKERAVFINGKLHFKQGNQFIAVP
jgi:hypothetical protein